MSDLSFNGMPRGVNNAQSRTLFYKNYFNDCSFNKDFAMCKQVSHTAHYMAKCTYCHNCCLQDHDNDDIQLCSTLCNITLIANYGQCPYRGS